MRASSLVLSCFATALCCSLAHTAAAQTLDTVRVASGLSSPVYVTAPPGDVARLFIVEQGGRIKIRKNGAVLATPFLNISSVIAAGGERGLLGLAFHPNYAANGFFYVYYTRGADGSLTVARYTVSANPDVANAGSGVTIFGPVVHPASNHNGGCIQFGPDGYLYFATGDGGGAGDTACNAQNGGTFLGKLIRIDVDGGFPYVVPPTNPFIGNATFLDEIWAYGLRNPWRWSFDRVTGDLYTGDVGQGSREEIDFQPAGSAGGENYGWKVMEGTACFGTSGCTPAPPPCNDPSYTDPIHDYGHAGNCSVTGGYVYRGCAIPSLAGTYFFADYCSNAIWSFRYAGGAVTQFTTRTSDLAPGGGLSIGSISSFGEDALGELYICDHGGEVFKVVPSGMTDCNANLTQDSCDIAFGISADVNSNGVPDECEPCAMISNYCTAGTTSNGCTAQISSNGTPSASAATPFTLLTSSVEGDKTGLFFYGITGAQATSWGSGTSFMCVKSPRQRTPSSSSGGTPNACDGALALDWNAYHASHPGALGQPLQVGEVFWAQTWFRDPPAPVTTSLSNAIVFTLCP